MKTTDMVNFLIETEAIVERVQKRITDGVAAGSTTAKIVEEALAEVAASERRALLAHYLWWDVRDKERDQQRGIEEDATRQALASGELVKWGRTAITPAEAFEREAINERHHTLLVESLSGAIEQFAQTIRLELTEELLASLFALGDGRQVTWGQATIADHQERITYMSKMAGGVLVDAARHKEAIRMLTEARAACLADMSRP